MIAESLGVTGTKDINAISEMARNVTTAAYVPKKITVKLPGEEEKKDEPAKPDAVAAPDDDEAIESILAELS